MDVGVKILFIILIIIAVIALLRISVILSYDRSGAGVGLRVAFFRFGVYPSRGRKKKKKPKKEKKKSDEPHEPESEQEKGGDTKQFKQWFDLVTDTLSKLRRHLRVNELTIRYTVACDDAAKAANLYGRACAAMSTLLPGLNNIVRVKKQDVKIDIDFTEVKSTIFARGIISLAIWEIIYIATSLIIPILQKGLLGKNKAKKKGGV